MDLVCYSPGILSLVILFLFLQQNHSSENHELEPLTIIPLESEQQNTSEPLSTTEIPIVENVIIDIKGAVKYPGVYELTSEERIIDVIGLAGGYIDEADTKSINHAQKLQDEMVIYIPTIGEQLVYEQVESHVSIPSRESSSSPLVNINTANESDLSNLPGIGPSKAQAIIAYREEHGRFQTVEDLKNVSGIGEKTFERLRDFITVK